MSNVRPRHLLTFKVEGRAVPWKVGMRRKDKRLRQWQSLVRDTASVAWGVGRLPHVGPVALSMWFYCHPPAGRETRTADATNLGKAFEDSIKGIIFGDDRDVFATHAERYFIPAGEVQKAYAQVWAMPVGFVIEPADPGPYAYRPWDWIGMDGC
jgi:hypothetical protein